MNPTNEILTLAEEILPLLRANITPDGQCQFDPIKVKLALELVKFEIEQKPDKTSAAD